MLVNSGTCVKSLDSLRNCLPISKTLLKPPITSCFRYSSGAILIYISCFASFKYVLNGLAFAPP